MASGFGQAVLDGVLDTIFGGNTTWTREGSLWLALLTTAHTSGAGGGTEVSTGVWTNYARLELDNDGAGTVWAAADAGKWNSSAIEFAAASITGTAPVIKGFALMTASSGGTIRAFGPLYVDQTVSNGNVFRFASGDLYLYANNEA